MSFRRLFMTALTVLSLAAAGQAAQYPDWPAPTPCIFGMPVTGRLVMKGNTGLITEILTAVFNSAGYDLVHTDLPYKRALDELAAGNIHCTLGIKALLKGDTTATITIYKLSVAFMRTDGFKDMNDLAGQKVAYMHGYDIQRLLPVKIRPQPVYDLTSAIRLLDEGHLRFVIDDHSVLEEAIQESHIPSINFEIAPLMSLNVVPVFSPSKEGRLLQEIYDRRMREMAASGELQRIMRENGLNQDAIENVIKAKGH